MHCTMCREFPSLADGNAFFMGTSSFRIQNLEANDSSKIHDSCSKAKVAKENPTKALAIWTIESEVQEKMIRRRDSICQIS